MTTRILSSLAALVVAALTVVSLTGPAPASAAAKKRTCADKGKRPVKVLARTKTAVVFERKARSGQDKGFFLAFACLYKRGENVPLGIDGDDTPLLAPALAGPYVAFGYGDCFGVEGLCGINVNVMDIRTRKTVRSASSFTGGDDHWVTDLVLTPSGFAAWISTSHDEDFKSQGIQVHALDSAGSRLLDSRADEDIKDLRLKGSTVSWKNAGQKRSATLG